MKIIWFIRITATFLIVAFTVTNCKKEEKVPNQDQDQHQDTVATLTDLDNAIKNKMSEYDFPALSIAIVKDEKLVYVKSYGLSDVESGIVAKNDDLYRIASLSKPITATAILKLVQDGLITLDQKVFGSNGILGNVYGIPPAGSKIDLITVQHLLDMKSGWINSPNDPGFTDIGYTQSKLINDLVTNRPLKYAPGSTYYYFGMGYVILGRVIEKITNVTYENYVKSNILQQCGITDMKIGGNTLNARYPKEVKYYSKYPLSEFTPYNMNVTRMDADAGWIASATDLARFIVRIDRNNSKEDLISTNLLNKFFVFVLTNWYVYGSLPGESGILCRYNDTFSFALLTNKDGEPLAILYDLYAAVVDKIIIISEWPSVDLF